MMKMIRTILPVGQGGFYTEMFQIEDKECLYVYDCGSHTEGEPESTIQSAIPDGTDIETLFISHFDKDHVNGIKELVSHRTIKKVVLPQIDKYHWFYILTNAMDNGGIPHPNLLADLQQVIKDAAIIQVAPFNEDEPYFEPHVYDEESNPQGHPIMSGDILNVHRIWEYIPINTASRQQINKLENGILPIFQRELPALQNLDSLPDQEVANIISRYTSEINEVYKQIFKNSNKASMCLYSGGASSYHFLIRECHNHCWCPRCYHNPHFYHYEACLYTGDADLTTRKLTNAITNLLGGRTERIATIQIPHHGSKYNSDVESMDRITDNHPVLFASYGTKNRHRHPSLYLLNQLKGAGYCVHEVTEFKHTSLVQVITMH